MAVCKKKHIRVNKLHLLVDKRGGEYAMDNSLPSQYIEPRGGLQETTLRRQRRGYREPVGV